MLGGIFVLSVFVWLKEHRSTVYLSLSHSIGVSSGAILVFDVPSKGSNITLSEVLEEHKESITDMASECSGSQVRHICVFCNLSQSLFVHDSVRLLHES